MQGHLLLTNCLEDEVTRPNIELSLKEGKLLWLDLHGTDDDVLALLREVFKIHPLAVEDVREFSQRPKIEDYDNFVSIVAYGARGLDRAAWSRCTASTPSASSSSVHRDELAAVDDACHALGRLPTDRRLVALYRLLDAMVDSMFPYLAAMDDRIDELQDQIFVSPQESQLAALFALKRQLVDMRKLVTPQRDMVSAMAGQVIRIPGMTAETERYVRDLYDHLIRISDMVDSYRDLLSGSLEAYMSMVSNRLNDVMRQLTIIATVFLPLSFLTGFFGQNLGWLVDHIGSLTAFLVFGIGTEVLAGPACSSCSGGGAGWAGGGGPPGGPSGAPGANLSLWEAWCRRERSGAQWSRSRCWPRSPAPRSSWCALEPGGEEPVRDLLADWAALQRAVRFRVPEAPLACIASIGSDAWDRLFSGPRPAELHPFRELAGTVHRAVSTPGDLLFHIRHERMDVCFEFASQVMTRLAGAVAVADEVHGFRYWDERDLLGFVDGTENPAGAAVGAAALSGDADPGFAGGSYVVVQKYLHDMAAWNALTVEDQEKVIGRTKLSDIELPDHVKPANSHVALNTIEDHITEGRSWGQHAVRRGRTREFGTYYIAYAATEH